MDLRTQLAAFTTTSKARSASTRAFELVHRATAELIASRVPERARRAGEAAPEFALEDPDGRVVSSIRLLAQGPLVVTFYRGSWCPYCDMELQALRHALPTVRELGARVVAISPQTRTHSRGSMRANRLGFPILSDPGNAVAARFGLRFTWPDYMIELYRSAGTDLAIINGDASGTLPMPARFLIGPDHRIAYAEVNPDYRVRPDPRELLPALRALARLPA